MTDRKESAVKLVGIAGASGSGKSYFARLLHGTVAGSALILSLDDYYKDRSDIPLLERQAINYDHPDALDFELFINHLQALKSGCEIEQPLYDFSIHNRRGEKETVSPAQVIIVDGILLYAVQNCRRLFDVRVYVDTPLDICFIRRLQRDIRERGRSVESVIQQYMQTVRPMFIEFVQPTRNDADIVVQGIGDMKADVDRVIGKIME
ncbi:uridine kinase [candidate division KSB1 bacterium]|nr:uridine kinase [candidate division KSB1 bacterium]RQW07599.1 MAG: uridine kinase [candidate division KSB1 bacterium]